MGSPDTLAAAGDGCRFEGLQRAATTGVGAMPHRDPRRAAREALAAFDVPTIPALPRLSPAERPVAQALSGVVGVGAGQYGAMTVDIDRLDPSAPVVTDWSQPSWCGFRTFLETAAAGPRPTHVKWQLAGPVSVGGVLHRAGAPAEVAYAVAIEAVCQHLRSLFSAIRAHLPGVRQIVVLDEPGLDRMMGGSFPLAPETVIDLLSTAMAALDPVAIVGLHTCAPIDLGVLIETGPHLVSIPISAPAPRSVAPLVRHLEAGLWVAWGTVATQGPIGVTATRSWHQLVSTWSVLARNGADPHRLRDQSMLTPQCALGEHNPVVAERVCRSLKEVARLVRSETTLARIVLGE